MKKHLLAFMLIWPVYASQAQLSCPPGIELKTLEGKWNVLYTNFPMWLKGDKTSPVFNYSIKKHKGKTGLHDEVGYLKKGKEKSIKGFDEQLGDGKPFFEWRGYGLMSALKSRWEILWLDEKAGWMLIRFQKTAFTPEGYDVAARKLVLDGETETRIAQKLKEMGLEGMLKPSVK